MTWIVFAQYISKSNKMKYKVCEERILMMLGRMLHRDKFVYCSSLDRLDLESSPSHCYFTNVRVTWAT
jgi:hypothetical protein